MHRLVAAHPRWGTRRRLCHRGLRFVLTGLEAGRFVNAVTVQLSFERQCARIRHFRVNRVRGDEARWLEGMLNREGGGLGSSVEPLADDTLALNWRT